LLNKAVSVGFGNKKAKIKVFAFLHFPSV